MAYEYSPVIVLKELFEGGSLNSLHAYTPVRKPSKPVDPGMVVILVQRLAHHKGTKPVPLCLHGSQGLYNRNPKSRIRSSLNNRQRTPIPFIPT